VAHITMLPRVGFPTFGRHTTDKTDKEFPNAFSDVLHSPVVVILVRVPKAI
jgi:hypothetical protein